MRQVSIFCTLGPASLNAATLTRLAERNVELLRINLSHTALDDVAKVIGIIREHVDLPICLDTEGAQVRTGTMEGPVNVRDRDSVTLTSEAIIGSAERFSLTPASTFETLEPGHLVEVDFDGVVLEVVDVRQGEVDTVVLNGGKIGTNKAVTVEPAPVLPPLSAKDKAAVQIGLDLGVRDFALSFANRPEDVVALRELCGPDARIIAKVESISGLRNLDGILSAADEILIDRGDLSREVPLESISFLQKMIIRKANLAGVPVNVATNLLESMLVNRKPTRAEVNDIINTLLDGAGGLVLAAETAIGSHPIAAVDMVSSLIEKFSLSLEGLRVEDLIERNSLVLTRYHGDTGRGAPAMPPPDWAGHGFVDELPSLAIDTRTALDVAQIGNRVYSPLKGFMTRDELDGVLTDYRLPSGVAWTMPILLQNTADALSRFEPGQTIRLTEPDRGDAIALLHITDKFQLDQQRIAQDWYGTTDESHPGVARFFAGGDYALGGPIEMLDSAKERTASALSPAQVRRVFDIKGWTKVVGFHTRNVPHRGHEFLIANAMERANADGVLIHPVMGPKRAGDFRPEVINGAYEVLVRTAFQNAMLASFRTYSRFAGPREAVFTALCRKNYGCSHFAIGRDHAGTGDFYGPNDNFDLFERLGDIGITPVFFDAVAHSPELGRAVESTNPTGEEWAISGTRIRDLLVAGEDIPEWLMRPEVARYLADHLAEGNPLFEN